jgi:hypothetical protein
MKNLFIGKLPFIFIRTQKRNRWKHHLWTFTFTWEKITKTNSGSHAHNKMRVMGCLLWPRIVPRKRFSLSMSWNWNILMGTNTFEHAEFKCENFPHRRPAVFSQTAILSSVITDKFFHCSTTRMDKDTRLHNSKSLIPMNQSLHWTKTRFAWIILSYLILSALDVNNIILSTTLGRYQYRFVKSSVLAVYLYKITRTSMLGRWAISLEWEIIPYMWSKCFTM